MKSYDILKKYRGIIGVEDYQVLKKELKLLRTYRQNTTLFTLDNEQNISGSFMIHNNNDDFDYFRKNEYLPKVEVSDETRNK